MKIKNVNIAKSIQLNISHSSNKFVSKVSAKDVKKYLDIIGIKNPNIICLAVRNSRELDLFRVHGLSSFLFNIIYFFEIKRLGFKTILFSSLEKLGICSSNPKNQKKNGYCLGNEINPKMKRKDILNCDFNKLPNFLTNKFDICYFNSLDHSYDPKKTAKEIKRIVKLDGFIIINYPEGQGVSNLDPTSDIEIKDIIKLFGNKVIYSKQFGSAWGYSEYIIKNSK